MLSLTVCLYQKHHGLQASTSPKSQPIRIDVKCLDLVLTSHEYVANKCSVYVFFVTSISHDLERKSLFMCPREDL